MLDLAGKIEKINTIKSMSLFIDELRILASNNKSNNEILDIIDFAIQRSRELIDKKSLVKLFEIKISQIEHLKERLSEIEQIVQQMKDMSEEIGYMGGLALAYNIEWYLERYKGKKEKSLKALENSMNYVNQYLNPEEYEYNVCCYSFAAENWFSSRDLVSSSILEKCSNYFYNNNFYRSYIQSLSILLVIYQQTQNKNKSMDLTRQILERRGFLSTLPDDLKSLVHFFIGFSQELSFNLQIAEEHLQEVRKLLKPIYGDSIYSSYYLTALSYLSATFALQGKLELAYYQMKEVDVLIDNKLEMSYLDDFSKEQMKHIFNLTKFYIHSRLHNFDIENLRELIQKIQGNISKYYSNSILLSEFLLNANLSKEDLIQIRNLQNPSTKRVEHILNYLIDRVDCIEQKQIIDLINVLKTRPAADRMTFVERAFADLLAAQEYFKLERYTEIYPLLRKYKNQLHNIEVLELRIFMEAFIQIGAFKNGDPMGPALQYLAIKKCKYQGFSRLENKLLNYLELQKREVLKWLD